MISSIIEKFNVQYCSVTDGEISHIILMLPYAPYSSYPPECANIDAFYEASNRLYHTRVKMSDMLVSNGYEILNVGHLQLKKIAERGGLGTIINNQLLATRDYGTRITLQDITIRGVFEHNPDLRVLKCSENCRECEIACPTGALCNGVFDRAKCLRNIQDNPLAIVNEMNKRVLGCEECQRDCPHNYKVLPCDIPDDISRLLNIDNLISQIASGKRSMQSFREVYGHNYSKPSWIAKLVIYSLLSSGDYAHSDSVSKLINHQNIEVSKLAKYYVTKCDKT